MSTDLPRARQDGVTLIELIIFIVIVSVGIVGILSVMNITTRASADPMVRKQALAIAESLLEEIQLQPFTFCDPEDANAATATEAAVSAAGCATTLQGIGPAGQTRYGNADGDNRFNNVGDYHGFSMNATNPPGIKQLDGTAIGRLNAYDANVVITAQGIGGVANADSYRIDVTVTGRGETITLTGYRLRYAPRAVP